MELAQFKTAAETLEAIATSLAILIGGLWAYRNLHLQAEHETAISVSVGTRVLQCHMTDVCFIEIRCTLRNNGKVPCQIDLQRSYISLRYVVCNRDHKSINWDEHSHFETQSFAGAGPLNIPVGSSMDLVEYAGVDHPGMYLAETFFAQTERAGRQFFRRIGQPFPNDWHTNPSGWSNKVLVSTFPGKEV